MTAALVGARGPAVAGDNSRSAPPHNPGTINPATGLSTDYLNHFAGVIMVLEMVAMIPGCVEDLRAWRPKTYREHFALSHFADRDAIIAAYRTTDPAVREALDCAAETLNAALVEIRDALIQNLASPDAGMLAQRAVNQVRPLIAHIAAIINGAAVVDSKGAQAAVDALFAR